MTARRIGLGLAVWAGFGLGAPSLALAAWGAVAVNKGTGAHGVAIGPSRLAASRSARQACGSDCRVVGWANSQCVAAVRFGIERSVAEQQATQACPGRCTVVVSVFARCAAVVHHRRRYTTGLGATKASAIRAARRRSGRRDARLTAWICV